MKINIFLFLIALTSCTQKADISSNETNSDTGTNYLDKTSDYIFDQNRLHTFELNLEDSLLAKLDADPAAEKYVEGSLAFEGETLKKVGIRYKGSVGAFVFCLSGTDEKGENFFRPSGHKVCTKLSMKIKIDWLNDEDRFYGLRKLQFHSQNLDVSKLRERMGYHLFRAMGVPAPRAVHARLIINGKYNGIYSLTEQIDEQFITDRFQDGSGNLYKEIWPIDYKGNPQKESVLIDGLETNKSEPSIEMMKTFGQTISAANDDNLRTVIEKWMDLDQIIRYIVVDRTIRVDDGAFHWYCGDKGCGNHNLYWYEEPSIKKVYLVPWDMDNTFENIISEANPVTPVADKWGEITADCEPFAYGAMGLKQRSAACDKLTGGWASYKEEFRNLKEEFIKGPLAKEKVDKLIDTWVAQIRDATEEASRIHEDATSIEDWDAAVNVLREQLDFARNP